MIERSFDISFVADLALREKQIQQNYRPIIAVHKWFARRPGTLFRSLLLSEFSNVPLREAFYQGHSLSDVSVLDPFMGGGTTLIEANRLGCAVTGFDINPMAYWIVREEIESLDLPAYVQAAAAVRDRVEQQVGSLYRTKCLKCGSAEAHVKYFLWVKTVPCRGCGKEVDLFPNYLAAEDRRHPANVFVCWNCGELFESASRQEPSPCPECRVGISRDSVARRGRCVCKSCKTVNDYPEADAGAPRHRMFAIEYHCPECKDGHRGRFFKKPGRRDLANYAEAEKRLAAMKASFIPDDVIPPGDETARLHRWGYSSYREMFNARQLLGLEGICREIHKQANAKIRRALATNLSDLLRYQNMLCRYDTMALKSLDVFSVHGFPVGNIQCESNLMGISGKASAVGSGGWLNIAEKFARAKSYCIRPFEIRHHGLRKEQVFIKNEWIGEERNGVLPPEQRSVDLACGEASEKDFNGRKFDAVLTDPPYFGNVQYAELMDFCYVWLRRLTGDSEAAFTAKSTRNANELTGNVSMGRGLEHFTEGLSAVFQKMARVLKPGSPLAFTYHHNQLEAYLPVAVAILDSGLTCSATIPCPAEMGASIHINGTGSSIIDTVFVCRSTGRIPRHWLAETPRTLAQLVAKELRQLRGASLEPTQGDIRCITLGHLIRLAVWNLRSGWERSIQTADRTKAVADWISAFGGLDGVKAELQDRFTTASRVQKWEAQEEAVAYRTKRDEISF
jgi:adenine-specific DNA methylase